MSFLLHHCSRQRSPWTPNGCTKTEITKTLLYQHIKLIPSSLLIWKYFRLHLPPVLSNTGLPSVTVNFWGFFNENFPLPAALTKPGSWPCSCSHRSYSCCVGRSSGWPSQACTCSALQKQRALFRKERALSIQWQPPQNPEITPNKNVTELTCLLQWNTEQHRVFLACSAGKCGTVRETLNVFLGENLTYWN